MTRTVLFLCSNGTHLLTFTPVAAALGRRGVESRFLSLDAYYGQDAEATAARAGVTMLQLARRGGALAPGSFYSRSAVAAWRDVVVARRPVRATLRRVPAPATVVLGNDFGLMEKLVLWHAKSLGMRTVLVQDGRLTTQSRRRPGGPIEQAMLRSRRLASRVLRAAGLPYLAASEYGEGGAEIICAAGEAGRKILSARSRGSRVVVTGQPRYDRLLHPMPAPARASGRLEVAAFPTPFAAAGLDDESQVRQQEMLAWLAEEVARCGGRTVVKPHPLESGSTYARVPLAEVVPAQTDPARLLAGCDVAVIGVSSLLEEAGLLTRPVIVPGARVHGRGFESLLPAATTYPRFESRADVARLLAQLSSAGERDALARRQSERVHADVRFSAAEPAGEAVADAILSS